MERLCAVKWEREWGDVFGKSISRRLLMREYLRRSALWAKKYSAENVWPFFDVTGYMDPEFRLSLSTAHKLEEFLRARMSEDVKATCRSAVRLAELRLHDSAIETADLPDLYEPLVRLYERGGEFMTDNSGALDLTGVSFRPGSLQGNLSDTPVVALHGAVLDALDVEGRVRFYASDSDRGPVFRRLLPQGGAARRGIQWTSGMAADDPAVCLGRGCRLRPHLRSGCCQDHRGCHAWSRGSGVNHVRPVKKGSQEGESYEPRTATFTAGLFEGSRRPRSNLPVIACTISLPLHQSIDHSFRAR